MANITASALQLLSDAPLLDSTNWSTWQNHMERFFIAVGIEGISSGDLPSDPKDLKDWKSVDKKLSSYLWGRIGEDYRGLIDGVHSAREAWGILKGQFQSSSMANRITARMTLYGISHDPSRHISVFIQSLTAARRNLTNVGVKIDDTEFKDIMLMRLDSSFESVRLSILSSTTEPDLEKVKSMLLNKAAADETVVKIEETKIALAARDGRQRSRGSRNTGEGRIDAQGYSWCDTTTTADDTCHRCGRTGHIAARCMFNMPQHVRDWIMDRRSRSRSPRRKPNQATEHAQTAYPHFTQHPYTSSHSHYEAEDSNLPPLLI